MKVTPILCILATAAVLMPPAPASELHNSLLQEGQKAMSEGKFDRAEQMFQMAVDESDTAEKREQALLHMSALLKQRGTVDHAKSPAERQKHEKTVAPATKQTTPLMAKRESQDFSASHAESWRHELDLVEQSREKDDIPEATNHARQALKYAELHKDQIGIARSEVILALLVNQEHPREYFHLLQDADKLAKKNLDYESLGTCLLGQAFNAAAKHDYDEAERLARESLTVRETNMGPKYKILNTNYCFLARVAATRGNHSEAEQLANKAVEHTVETCGIASFRTEDALETQAIVRCANQEWEKAYSSAEQGLSIAENRLGPQSRATVRWLELLSKIELKRGNESKSKEYQTRAETARMHNPGKTTYVSFHPDLPNCKTIVKDGSNVFSIEAGARTVEIFPVDTGTCFRVDIRVTNNDKHPILLSPNNITVDPTRSDHKTLQKLDMDAIARSIERKAQFSAGMSSLCTALSSACAAMQTQTTIVNSNSYGSFGGYGSAFGSSGYNSYNFSGTYSGNTFSTVTQPDYSARAAAAQREAQTAHENRESIAAARDRAQRIRSLALRPNTIEQGQEKSGTILFDRAKSGDDVIVKVHLGDVTYAFPLEGKKRSRLACFSKVRH